MSLSIAGKTAIVTGAAAGVGLAIGRHFVDRGARVMFADNDESRLADELRQDAAEEGEVRYFGGDLSQRLTLANLLSATVDAFERIDIVVNASRGIMSSDPLNADDPALEAMLNLNLLASLRLSQMAAKRMIVQAQKEEQIEGPIGAIVNVSTLAAHRAQPDLLAYSIAEAALNQATRSLAVALASHRIRVNAVSLASVMTASLQARLKDNPDWRDAIAEGTPLGRIAAASELVDSVQYLASDGSGFVTGQILTVDGGRGLLDPVQVPAY
ncbi:Dihydroanticapsin 7-dehydrogenase [Defluviimonas aquaemixtae]|uniref:Dihydroanticapsin 7-dehydrogenase n=1 Tax=Albidovulum aquaemixtae TaxID=1542388 RepID=A0A2R8BNB6_9RHOB|nr:SDR family oxidoreductase [Defluviimonas aquaemixtae]SPH24862.1 Dihydroanticapsin 7-dehydrogenase [Defluviimonas aquaemixtae]